MVDSESAITPYSTVRANATVHVDMGGFANVSPRRRYSALETLPEGGKRMLRKHLPDRAVRYFSQDLLAPLIG